jgi:hypothetical protein
MGWWESILVKTEIGGRFFTPGKGPEKLGKKPFAVISKDSERLIILSGKSAIPLEKHCFEVVEEAFSHNPLIWLRVASLRDNEPFENSVDKLVREATGSQLARGNYICSILEHCGLVRYAMRGKKKGIEPV